MIKDLIFYFAIMNKNKKGFAIYILSVTCIILLIFEFMILPWHFNLSRDLALLGFTAQPDIKIDDTYINSMGFTGDEITIEKSPDTIRLLTLGGSSFFNRRLTVRLKERFDGVSSSSVEILGAALRTHTSMSSLIKYRALSKYNFDYVLIYHGINDLFVNHVDPEYFETDFSHMGPWYKRGVLLDNSLVARVIYNNFIWGRKIFGGKKIWYIYPDEKNENSMNFLSEKLFRRNMKMLVKEIRKNNGTPVLMTFAWNVPEDYDNQLFRSGKVGYNNSDNYDRHPVELWGSVRYVKEGLRRHNNVLRHLSDRRDVEFIDQESLLGKDLVWFGDVCHLSDEGTAKFIDNIADYFVANNLI